MPARARQPQITFANHTRAERRFKRLPLLPASKRHARPKSSSPRVASGRFQHPHPAEAGSSAYFLAASMDSNSISKISVELGAMAPPAPCSP